jgi:hypothetical protein
MIEERFLYSPSMMPWRPLRRRRFRRFRFRPPGVRPWTRIGSLGPFRGRLGLAWVIAPLVLGVVLIVAFVLFLRA